MALEKVDRVHVWLVARLIDFLSVDERVLRSETLIRSLEPLLSFEIDDVRGAVSFVLDLSLGISSSVQAWLFLRIVNRIVFDVPEYTLPGFESFGGFRVPTHGELINELWPLRIEDGDLRVDVVRAAYGGDVFDALGEFDEFSRRFPRRTSLNLQ